MPDEIENADSKRQPSIGFSVKFLSYGSVVKTIHENTAKQTMIEALRYMGLEKASRYDGENFLGYRLVGKIQRITDGNDCWQQYVDGWWIYTNLSNERKIKCLQGVAKMLNMQIEIVADKLETATRHITETVHSGRQQYILNSKYTAGKNQSVFNAVKLFTKENPRATFNEIRQMFPKELQGSFGVVATLQEIESRAIGNVTEHKRWFLNQVLTSADGIRFAVCNQWRPDNFTLFKKHIGRRLGWTLKEL